MALSNLLNSHPYLGQSSVEIKVLANVKIFGWSIAYKKVNTDYTL